MFYFSDFKQFMDQNAYSVDQQLDQLSSDASVLDSPAGEQVLPYGWEIVQDPKYGTFYIDHINKHTQYEPPNVKDFEMAEQARVRLLDQFEQLNIGDIKTGSEVAECIVDSSFGTDASSKLIGVQSEDLDKVDKTRFGLDDRQSPNGFTNDLNQLRGPLVNTTLVKSPRGFGFTIIGGSDCNRPSFLQVCCSFKNYICL